MRRVPGGPCHTPRRGILLALTAVFASVAPIALRALPARAAEETQVPLDHAGRIESLDRWLARQLGLFVDEYPLLQEVRLYHAADSSFVLEITQREGGRRTRARLPFTAAEVDSLRDLVGVRVATRAPGAALDQSGRPLLLAGCAGLGLGFYAWAVPTLLDVQGGEAYGGTYMLVSATSILLPMVITQGTDVSFPAADLAIYGATRGIAHGALLYDGLVRDPADHGVLGLALAGSLVEGAALGTWAQATHASGGVAGSIGTGGDFGLLYGLGIADLTDLIGDEHDGALAACTLGGSGLGMAGGYWLARHRDYTYGDAGAMRTAGLVGAYLGLGLARASGAEESEPATAAAMAGGVVGLMAGDAFVSRTDLTGGQKLIVDLVTVAGGLFGLGAGMLAGEDADEPDRVILPASALGAVAGYAAGFSSVHGRARGDAGPGSSNASYARQAPASWHIGLEPRASRVTRRHGTRQAAPPLFLTLRCRFD